jgi:hypothetical protein
MAVWGRADALPNPADWLRLETAGGPAFLLSDRDRLLRGAPAMARNEGLCKDALTLPAVRAEDRQDWIMVTLNRQARR